MCETFIWDQLRITRKFRNSETKQITLIYKNSGEQTQARQWSRSYPSTCYIHTVYLTLSSPFVCLIYYIILFFPPLGVTQAEDYILFCVKNVQSIFFHPVLLLFSSLCSGILCSVIVSIIYNFIKWCCISCPAIGCSVLYISTS